MRDFFAVMFSSDAYKKKQGKVARMSTAAAIFVLLLAGVYQLYNTVLAGSGAVAVYIVPLLLVCLSAWFSYRVVNYVKFADFLIQVEAEMRKVSWPGKSELLRSSWVVICVMFLLTILLFGYDIILRQIFYYISVMMDALVKMLGIF